MLVHEGAPKHSLLLQAAQLTEVEYERFETKRTIKRVLRKAGEDPGGG